MRYILCGIASILLGISIYFYCVRPIETSENKKFEALLNDEQIQIYYNAIDERRSIFFKGKVVAFIICLLLIKFILKKKTICRYCILVICINFIAGSIYFIYPKTNDVMGSLKTDKQHAAYNEVIKSMYKNIISGGILGIIGYVIIVRVFF